MVNLNQSRGWEVFSIFTTKLIIKNGMKINWSFLLTLFNHPSIEELTLYSSLLGITSVHTKHKCLTHWSFTLSLQNRHNLSHKLLHNKVLFYGDYSNNTSHQLAIKVLLTHLSSLTFTMASWPTTTTLGAMLDFTTSNPARIGRYNRATCVGLSDEAKIKEKEAAVCKILVNTISTVDVVDSYDSSKINKKNNFFKFIGMWQNNVNFLMQHCQTFCMHLVFDFIQVIPQTVPAPPSSPGGTLLTVHLHVTYNICKIG